MTTARPIPPHGTYARANGSPGYRPPCKCEPCLITRRRNDKRGKVNRQLGRRAEVDATEARQHIELLRATRTWASISEATQVTQSGLLYIANGSRTSIHRRTHARILAVQPLSQPFTHMQIDALGTRRRLQALMAIGHSLRTLSTAASVAKDRVHDIAMGLQPTVRYDVAERIAATYERLAFRPPARDKFTSRTRNLAASRGWHGPLAWDGDIDDPATTPEAGEAYIPAAKYRRDPLRRGEIEHLYLLGESVPSIAKQLGGNERYIADRVDDIIRERQARAEQERLAARQRTGQQAAA
ncbi:hypothetical protein [Streptomyces sp. NPDC054887]